ncbi:hypothetical protein GN956_G25875 [Arapaima gigas]
MGVQPEPLATGWLLLTCLLVHFSSDSNAKVNQGLSVRRPPGGPSYTPPGFLPTPSHQPDSRSATGSGPARRKRTGGGEGTGPVFSASDPQGGARVQCERRAALAVRSELHGATGPSVPLGSASLPLPYPECRAARARTHPVLRPSPRQRPPSPLRKLISRYFGLVFSLGFVCTRQRAPLSLLPR